MKITILQGAFLPVPTVLGGAVEKMWYALGKDFASQGHEVTQISRAYPGLKSEELIDGVLHKRVKGYSTPSSGLYLKWLDLLYTLRTKSVIPKDSDIVITNTFWAPILLNQRLKKRCVVDVQRVPKGQMKWYTGSLILRSNSSFVEKAIKDELPANHHNQVKMIPNPLPFKNHQDIDLLEKKNIVLYCGRVHPEKGLELLISAFKHMQNWKLKIVGPWEISAGGGGKDYLEKLRLLSKEEVEFTGPIFDNDELNHIYREASIFVYPSVAEKGETFGLAPLEAMSWGCVPIVSDLDCFKDFITDKRNGLIFNHRDNNAVELLRKAILYMQMDNKKRLELATEAIKVQDSHSTQKIACSFLQEFQKSIHDQGRIH